jgi:hypothetical protein
MSNAQLYLSIGIPSFLVVLSLLISLFQSNRLADRLDRVSDRFDRQFEKLADKVDRLHEQQHKDVLMLMEQIVTLNDRMAKIEG